MNNYLIGINCQIVVTNNKSVKLAFAVNLAILAVYDDSNYGITVIYC